MRARSIVCAAAMLLPALLSARPAAAAVTAGEDRLKSTPTSWWTYVEVTPAVLTDKINTHGARLTDLEIRQTASGPRLTATMVRNTGEYAASWWWYYGLSSSQLAGVLAGRRIIDLEPYLVNGSPRYAAILVSNASPSDKAWWYYIGVTTAVLSDRLATNTARLIDVDSLVVGGTRRYYGVMISNTSTDARSWWWYVGRTGPQVSSLLSGRRLISLDRRSDGLYDVVMYAADGIGWFWYYNAADADALLSRAAQLGARLIDVEPYTTSTGAAGVAGVMVNNANALTVQMRETMRTAIPNGTWGFYLKKVGGPVLASLQHGKRFEPASAVKALLHLHAILKEQLGSSEDADTIVRHTGYSGSCPTGGTATTTVGNADLLMMKNSDNQMTEALLAHFGPGYVLATADLIGMRNTEWNHTIGCFGFDTPRNWTTLADLAKITEVQMNGRLLTEGFRDKFHDREINETWSGFDPFYCAIVDEQAAALGLSGAVADAFCDAIVWNAKGGSYTLNNDVSNQTIWRSDAGRMSLPFKQDGVVVPVHYAFGHFIDSVRIARTAGAETPITNARNEMVRTMWRAEINAALQTWA